MSNSNTIFLVNKNINNKRKDILESSNFLKYVFFNMYIAQNTIVGARKWNGFGTDLPVMGYDKLIESSANYPKTGDIISIKLYNNTTGETIDLAFSENNYPFGSNQIYIIGSILLLIAKIIRSVLI